MTQPTNKEEKKEHEKGGREGSSNSNRNFQVAAAAKKTQEFRGKGRDQKFQWQQLKQIAVRKQLLSTAETRRNQQQFEAAEQAEIVCATAEIPSPAAEFPNAAEKVQHLLIQGKSNDPLYLEYERYVSGGFKE
ncbi:hypothetical protein M9H77_23033 [Catharanthus roseus]|uniref:Uncharacterized protein n=1 Tax=Catharanthus roseus TaxID=4058 RepID=A0ACC0ATW8_CATRO|nr:hypothetical protein M9H77_23033 [Catharanthus roseus]